MHLLQSYLFLNPIPSNVDGGVTNALTYDIDIIGDTEVVMFMIVIMLVVVVLLIIFVMIWIVEVMMNVVFFRKKMIVTE